MSQARLAASRSAGSLRRGSKVLALTGFLALLLSLLWTGTSNAGESTTAPSAATYTDGELASQAEYAYDTSAPIARVESRF